jgi:hypothetical protein
MSRTVRALLIVITMLVAVYVLFTVVFPWIDRQFFANPVLG